jgi:glycerate 2-kinase
MTTGHAAIEQPPAQPADGLLPIRNGGPLLDHGLRDLRRLALDVVAAGIRAANPAAAVDRLVHVQGSALAADGHHFDLSSLRSVLILGAGKASAPIAATMEAKLGDRLAGGLVVSRRDAAGPADQARRRVEIAEADHPVPSLASLAAGRRLMLAAAAVRPGDLVITAFTGGSSALACLPPDGVSFAAKQRLHQLLLDSGAPIAEVNAVRKHVSALKGGRLAAAMNGATLLNLTLSDVPDDSADLLCDPVVQDTTDTAAAVTVLQRYHLWQDVGAEVRRHLGSTLADSPVLDGRASITTVLLVSGRDVAAAMAARVRALGWEPVLLGSTFEGEAEQTGGLLGAFARESSQHGHPFRPGSVLIGAGGESTVRLHRAGMGSAGVGGPNQELALSFARAIARRPSAVAGVFVDSDGSDGGTDAAGGCVDSTTAPTAATGGVNLDEAVLGHDSRAALRQLGDLVITGPTGTNVSDLWAIAIGAGPPPDPGGRP